MVRTLVLAAPLLLLSGCAVGPDHAPPNAPNQSAWPAPLEAGVSTEAADLRAWWSGFHDPILDSLIDRAFAGSLDLREAAARVKEARALRGLATADRLPAVDARGSGTLRRSSGNSFGGPGGPPGEESDLYDAGFDASWELDLFGGVRRSIEAADADAAAAVESQRDARVVLAAEVARNYILYRSAQARLGIARQNVQAQQETLDLSSDRFNAGIASELDVARARAQLETTRSRLPTLQASLRAAAFRLDVLLGLMPGALAPELEAGAAVPPTPAAIPIGLPAELVRRRPDIRRAERALAAATARVGVATADLYPRFTLDGSFGFESGQFGTLFRAGSRTWAAGPLAVRWPVFDGGRIRSNIRASEARQEQALVAYERAVLAAYEEVANALVAYARVRERRDSLAQAVEADRRAVELASELWRRGLSDFLNVLDTQRVLFQLEDQLAESDAEVTTNLVALYKALGGGWDHPDAEAAGPDASPPAGAPLGAAGSYRGR